MVSFAPALTTGTSSYHVSVPMQMEELAFLGRLDAISPSSDGQPIARPRSASYCTTIIVGVSVRASIFRPTYVQGGNPVVHRGVTNLWRRNCTPSADYRKDSTRDDPRNLDPDVQPRRADAGHVADTTHPSHSQHERFRWLGPTTDHVDARHHARPQLATVHPKRRALDRGRPSCRRTQRSRIKRTTARTPPTCTSRLCWSCCSQQSSPSR